MRGLMVVNGVLVAARTPDGVSGRNRVLGRRIELRMLDRFLGMLLVGVFREGMLEGGDEGGGTEKV